MAWEESIGLVAVGQLPECVPPRAVQQRRECRSLAHCLLARPWCVVQMPHPSPCVLPCDAHIPPPYTAGSAPPRLLALHTHTAQQVV